MTNDPLIEQLSRIVRCAAHEGRHAVVCITADGLVAATDGRRLIVERYVGHGLDGLLATLDAADLGDALGVMRDMKSEIPAALVRGGEDDTYCLSYNAVRWNVRYADDRFQFPDWRPLLPEAPPVACALVNPCLLASILPEQDAKFVESVADVQDELTHRGVAIGIWEAHKPLVVWSVGEAPPSMALLMPRSSGDGLDYLAAKNRLLEAEVLMPPRPRP